MSDDRPSLITSRPTTTTERDFSYWDDIPPIYHYPVHLTDAQVSDLYSKLDLVPFFSRIIELIKILLSGRLEAP